MNPIRDVTNKALQYRHISAVLTELINGLDTRLRGYDKSFRTSFSAGMTKRFHTSFSAGMTKRFRTSLSAGMTGKNGGMPEHRELDTTRGTTTILNLSTA
ncbi:MAG: hypothetical protein RBS43_10895 [Candidatus Cloacimonas sp.]|jgi:hypothetical protein|nr:hypothetical protein [Candidatus Cloacimonas sp.]